MTDNKAELNKLFDRTKTKVFLGANSAFLGPLMCSINFIWDDSCETAYASATTMGWNPDFFLSLDEKSRITILKHELWHIARLHGIRIGERNREIWNYACDYVINNTLDHDKEYMGGFPYVMDHKYDGMSEEEIYDIIYENSNQLAANALGQDIRSMTKDQIHQMINVVMQAHTQASLGGGWATTGAGDSMSKMFDQFLAPKVQWEKELLDFFTAIGEMDYSWKRPNRRYLPHGNYLPSLVDGEGRLNNIRYYIDASGSITDRQVIRFNSECKYIKDRFNPELFSMVFFDTKITAEYDFTPEDVFENIEVVGRGGTDLAPVREDIIKHKPDAVIIFSDLLVEPMIALEPENMVPIIWVTINNMFAQVPHGKIIHMRE